MNVAIQWTFRNLVKLHHYKGLSVLPSLDLCHHLEIVRSFFVGSSGGRCSVYSELWQSPVSANIAFCREYMNQKLRSFQVSEIVIDSWDRQLERTTLQLCQFRFSCTLISHRKIYSVLCKLLHLILFLDNIKLYDLYDTCTRHEIQKMWMRA